MQITVIQQKIYDIRGFKVMFDFDLAELYGVETKRLKEAVRRNRSRFPKDFLFELSKKEMNNLRTQIASSSWGGMRYKPFAFTEHGITMLASILNSQRAIKMNIAIVRAFIAFREFALNYKKLAEKISKIKKTVTSHHEQLNQIYLAIENLMREKEKKKAWEDRERIGFRK